MQNTIRFIVLLMVLIATVTLTALTTITKRKQSAEERQANEVFQSILANEAQVLNTSNIVKEELIHYANNQLISGNGTFDDEKLAAIWEKGSAFLRNVGIAPQNVLTQVWPHESNELAIGLKLDDMQEQWHENMEILKKQHSLMTGPFKLAQGGVGLIVSIPLYHPSGAYWGQASQVIDLAKLGNEFQRIAGKDISIAILKGGRTWYSGSDEALYLASNKFFFRLMNLNLDLAIVVGSQPVSNTLFNDRTDITILTILLFLAILVAITYWSRQNEETKTIRLQGILDAARDPILVIDRHGNIETFNKRALTLFALDNKTTLTGNISQFIPELALLNKQERARYVLQDHSDITITTKSGNRYRADIRIGANRDANVNQIFITIRLHQPVIDERIFNDSDRNTALKTS